MIARLWKYLHSTPPLTWIGHGLQGFLWGFASDFFAFPVEVAWTVLVFHFTIREGEDIIKAIANRPESAALLWFDVMDGVLDLVTPFVGLLFYILIS